MKPGTDLGVKALLALAVTCGALAGCSFFAGLAAKDTAETPQNDPTAFRTCDQASDDGGVLQCNVQAGFVCPYALKGSGHTCIYQGPPFGMKRDGGA
jgi:hypothetical protein